ncbi:MAG: hypothetical protein V1776_02555 [Candidatus Diapherotrites archaeon]
MVLFNSNTTKVLWVIEYLYFTNKTPPTFQEVHSLLQRQGISVPLDDVRVTLETVKEGLKSPARWYEENVGHDGRVYDAVHQRIKKGEFPPNPKNKQLLPLFQRPTKEKPIPKKKEDHLQKFLDNPFVVDKNHRMVARLITQIIRKPFDPQKWPIYYKEIAERLQQNPSLRRRAAAAVHARMLIGGYHLKKEGVTLQLRDFAPGRAHEPTEEALKAYRNLKRRQQLYGKFYPRLIRRLYLHRGK